MDVREYQTQEGHLPFIERLEGIRNCRAAARIAAATAKMKSGLFGQWRSLGRGLHETKINQLRPWLPRLLKHEDGHVLVVLLHGARQRYRGGNVYWKNYKTRKQAVQRGRSPARRRRHCRIHSRHA